MVLPFFKRHVPPNPQPSSLGSLLVILFMAQILVTGGMILFLSSQNTEEAVRSLKNQLRRELAKRIKEELTQYFSIPHNINQLNAAAYRRGEIDIFAATGEAQLYEQLKQFPNISFAYCGSDRNGEFFGVLHDPSDETHPYQLSYSNPSTQSFRQYYSLDQRGDRIELIRTIEDKSYFRIYVPGSKRQHRIKARFGPKSILHSPLGSLILPLAYPFMAMTAVWLGFVQRMSFCLKNFANLCKIWILVGRVKPLSWIDKWEH